MPQNLRGVYARLILATLLWGGTFIAGRFLAQGMPHFTAASLRFVFALLGLLVFMRATATPWPTLSRAQHGWIFVLGATGIFAYNAGFFASLGLIGASRAALIVAASPLMTFVLVQFIEGARWSPWRLAGVLLSFIGCVMVVSHGHPAQLLHGAVGLGELYLFGAVCAWVVYTLVIRYRLQGVPALPMTLLSAAWGGLLLGLCALGEIFSQAPRWPDLGQWAAMAYLGLFGTTLAFVWYNHAVSRIGAARATQFTNLVPVFGVLLSVLLLGEALPWASVLGGLMVVAGVMLAGRQKKKQ